jgi:hypothetical protein
MLLARYFLSVGGVLLALLFITDAVAPKVPAAATDSNDLGTDKAVIRIHTDRKWPEAVVFDTNVPAIAPAQTVKAEARCTAPGAGRRRLGKDPRAGGLCTACDA